MIQPDEVITLPSGTELSIEAAQGDISRALSYWNDVEDEMGEGLAADLLHVAELLDWLRERVNAPDLLEAAKRTITCRFCGDPLMDNPAFGDARGIAQFVHSIVDQDTGASMDDDHEAVPDMEPLRAAIHRAEGKE